MIDMSSPGLRIGARKFFRNRGEFAPGFGGKLPGMVHRSEANISRSEKGYRRLFAVNGQAIERSELSFQHMFLQFLEQRWCHRAQAIDVHFRWNVTGDAQPIGENDAA